MARARRAGLSALIVVVLAAAVAGWGGAGVRAGDVGWPPSTLVLSEVQTGGASASDEFVEVANQGAAPVDLLGLEVVYATSSGSTVTRKATLGGVARARTREADPHRQRERGPRRHRRRDVFEWFRGHRRGDRVAGRRRFGDRCRRLG